MAQPKSETSWLKIPEGYRPVPLRSNSSEGGLRACVLARSQPDPAEGNFVLLRDWEDTSVYLGCLLDAADRVYDWIELWVQNPSNLEASPSGYRERLTNPLLDRRWSETAVAFSQMAPDDFLSLGWEQKHPAPVCLNLRDGCPVEVVSAEAGAPWQLCVDNDRLKAAGLPAYGGSAHRYLCQNVDGGADRFLPVTDQAPENAATAPFDEAVQDGASLVRLNAHGGLMMARRWTPLDWESYAGVLSGQAWSGAGTGQVPMAPGGAYALLSDIEEMESSTGYLFSARQGVGARVLESLHLKLQLLADAVSAVRSWVAHHQSPFLNLSPESFRVALNGTSDRLPCLWSARVRLAKPGSALALPMEESEFRYFLTGKTPQPFVYMPEGIGASLRGQGTVRVREVRAPENGRSVVEGTLVAKDALNISPHDLIWIRVPLAGERIDFYGHLYAEEGLASGEARFRTLPMRLTAARQQSLTAASGTALNQASFEIVPLLSTPCDLYSLGVLAVRTLLVNEENTLAIALDEILSLARQADVTGDEAMALEQRIQALLDGEARWLNALGPHRLRHASLEPALATSLVPAELWAQLLAWMVRMFPGVHRLAYAKDYGDAPAAALEAVFNHPLRDLDHVLAKSRSLVVLDWNQNREVHRLIEKFTAGSEA